MTFIGPKPPSQNEPLKLPPLTPAGEITPTTERNTCMTLEELNKLIEYLTEAHADIKSAHIHNSKTSTILVLTKTGSFLMDVRPEQSWQEIDNIVSLELERLKYA